MRQDTLIKLDRKTFKGEQRKGSHFFTVQSNGKGRRNGNCEIQNQQWKQYKIDLNAPMSTPWQASSHMQTRRLFILLQLYAPRNKACLERNL